MADLPGQRFPPQAWRRATIVALAAPWLATSCLPPEWGANAILHPLRRPLSGRPALAHEDVSFSSDGLLLKGWIFRPHTKTDRWIVYLHGVADNRESGVGLAERYVRQGYSVLAYDARAHGDSQGSECTYGYYEKRDLTRALDSVGASDAILFGSSLGAAVALQAAAIEPRVRGVVAESTFADLESVVRERAPFFATRKEVDAALALAERMGHFVVAEVSPLKAAPAIKVPVLLIHGSADKETRPAHSVRVHAALLSPKKLVLVPGAGHRQALGAERTWRLIDQWIASIPPKSGGSMGEPSTRRLDQGDDGLSSRPARGRRL